MGYYTDFYISTDDNLDEILERLSEFTNYSFSDDGHTNGKWYSYEDDIIAVSKLFPATLITVRGYGEESGDIWVLYALNGNTEKHKLEIVFPPPTLTPPTKEYRTINVTVAGVDVPIEIECYTTTTNEEAYQIAKNKLKSII